MNGPVTAYWVLLEKPVIHPSLALTYYCHTKQKKSGKIAELLYNLYTSVRSSDCHY